MLLGNFAEEKSSFLLEGSLNGNVVRFKNKKAFSRENFEFCQVFPKPEKSVYKSAIRKKNSLLFQRVNV